MSYTIIGVIGHIDHGKTTLVTALSGVNTDTLPEEKRRGITIDLGFATFQQGEHRFALIDAPGHQKYIGNLLAGVSQIDIGLLVVAGDQGIEQQTLEHAGIAQALGIEKLVVVISRVDQCEAATVQALTEELHCFLSEYGFRDFPVIPVSALTGMGIDRLREALVAQRQQTQRPSHGPFRMPVDRVLNVPGRGTVVTGTLWSGTVGVGDHVAIAGTDHVLRVREIEVHGQACESSSSGLRTAINITGESVERVRRGDELVTGGTFSSYQRHLVRIELFPDSPPLRCPANVQLHTATGAVEARIATAEQTTAGDSSLAIVDTKAPITTQHGQGCLFRKPYPVGSFAGGQILASLAGRGGSQRQLLALANELMCNDAAKRLSAWVDFHGELQLQSVRCQIDLGIDPQQFEQAMQTCIDQERFVPIDPRNRSHSVVSCATIRQVQNRAMELAKRRASDASDAWITEESLRQQLQKRCRVSAGAAAHAIAHLVRDQQLVCLAGRIAAAPEQASLSKKARATMDQILQTFHASRQPPTIKQLTEQLNLKPDVAQSLVRFAIEGKLLTDLGNGFVIDTDVLNELLDELAVLLSQRDACNVAEIRDHWKITRKHAIPLLEFCDAHQLTQRQGDCRTAGDQLSIDKRNRLSQRASHGSPGDVSQTKH